MFIGRKKHPANLRDMLPLKWTVKKIKNCLLWGSIFYVKRACPLEEKIMIVKAFKNGTHTISELEFIYNVRNVTIYEWVYKYEKYGVDGLKESSTWSVIQRNLS